MSKSIELTVNGNKHWVDVNPNETLLDILRDKLGLTGAKYGCGSGDCGACTVLMDGKPVASCLVLAISSEGKEILTIEGVSGSKDIHPIQDAFISQGAVQCGYCTPGLILTTKGLLDENPGPSEKEIKKYIKGNLCRCTGYTKIIKAISVAAVSIKCEGGL